MRRSILISVALFLINPAYATDTSVREMDQSELEKMLPPGNKVGQCEITLNPIVEKGIKTGTRITVKNEVSGKERYIEFKTDKKWIRNQNSRGSYTVPLLTYGSSAFFPSEKKYGWIATRVIAGESGRFYETTERDELDLMMFYDNSTRKLVGVSFAQTHFYNSPLYPLVENKKRELRDAISCGEVGSYTDHFKSRDLYVDMTNGTSTKEVGSPARH